MQKGAIDDEILDLSTGTDRARALVGLLPACVRRPACCEDGLTILLHSSHLYMKVQYWSLDRKTALGKSEQIAQDEMRAFLGGNTAGQSPAPGNIGDGDEADVEEVEDATAVQGVLPRVVPVAPDEDELISEDDR